MNCPKCGNDNLTLQSTCFYCGVDLPKERIRGVVSRKPVQLKPARPAIPRKIPRTHMPKVVDIKLPCDQGSVRLTFTKNRHGGQHVRLQYRGINGKFRKAKEIDDPVVMDVINAVKLIHL